METSWQGVGDHDRTGPDEKLWTGRHVEPPFKLLFEAHAFMELTDRETDAAIMLQGADWP